MKIKRLWSLALIFGLAILACPMNTPNAINDQTTRATRTPVYFSSAIKVGPFEITQLDVANAYVKMPNCASDEILVFKMMSSGTGSEPASLRGKKGAAVTSGNEWTVKVEEEQSKDTEVIHEIEKVAVIKAKKGLLKSKDLILGEAGSIEISRNTSSWKTINLNSAVGYTKPVIIASLATINDGSACHVRIRNVTNTSFQIELEEWAYLNGPHPTETINYIVINAINDDSCRYYVLGKNSNSSSEELWALSANTDKLKMKTQIKYQRSFGYFTDYINQEPFLFAEIQTCNNTTPLIVRTTDIEYSGGDTSNKYTCWYQEQELDNSKSNEYEEVVGHFEIGPIEDEGISGVVEKYGKLQVKNNKLVNEAGTKIVRLTGMSAFWMNWEDGKKFANDDVIAWLIKDWKIKVYRAAMGVRPEDPTGKPLDVSPWKSVNIEEPRTGYVDDKAGNLKTLEAVITSCIYRGIYVIIDWHVHDALSADNKAAALLFFDDISKRYGDKANIIYEIWNEPSWPNHVRFEGDPDVIKTAVTDANLTSKESSPLSWSAIKTYCKEIINVIRKNDPDNIIIAPSPCWDQWVDQVADSPIIGSDLAKTAYAKNIMYSFHFYSGSHVIKKDEKAPNPSPGALMYYNSIPQSNGKAWTWSTAEAYADNYLTEGGLTTPKPSVLGKDPLVPNIYKMIWNWNFDPWIRLDSAVDTIPIFVTEWGTTLYDGGQPYVDKATGKTIVPFYSKASDDWLTYMNTNSLSWCNWSVSDKNEGASILISGANTHGFWKESDLTASGKYIRQKLRQSYDTPDKNL